MSWIPLMLFVGCLIGTQCSTLIKVDHSIQEHATVIVDVAKYLADFLVEFERYQSTDRISESFVRLLDLINSNDVIALDEMLEAKSPKVCLTCLSASNTFLEIYKRSANKEKEYLVKIAQDICNLYNFKSYVCEGVVSLNADMILYILERLETIPTAEGMCEVSYQGNGCVAAGSDILSDRYPKVYISSSKNELKSSKTSSSYPTNQSPLIIVHLTDIHLDPEYVVGVNAECGSSSCCRVVPDLEPADASNAAGYWGDYRKCDSPWHAVVDVVDQIRSQHPEIDAIYFTGDIIHHFTWNTTLESNKESMSRIYRLLKDRFAGVPFYPTLGNHEAHPSNLFAPHDVPEVLNTKYLYDHIADEWEEWLRDESVNDTLADGGYYTVLSPLGHRVIALNNNFCFVRNWWLLFSNDYFIQQLQWLHDTLLEAEGAGEKVHILGHVPSYDNDCYIGWTREYRKIVERFAHIIEGQFNGHSHVDEFNVYYRKDDPSVAVNVAWNGGSTTTFSRLNPNYKVFYVDRTNFEILDQETWIYNLTEANQHPTRKPNWFKEYTFKANYGLNDLSPNSLDGLVHKLANSESDLLQYWQLKQKSADPLLTEGCDQNCLRSALCAIVRTEYGDDAACERLLMTGSRK
ncbi:sphingomyelin phosphodiesterase-like [Topomyia yanbarensis]|uniref:sphingomyelin phosphodiesterase-like n=1 Tax=Topomyia yanbarensis TaxID=2498891 RepID=UPI00273CBC33|nr:sphingomyelin phosphodiesterase-like [Topomyia yanbarensis]